MYLSIIIPLYNCGQYIERCLDSIFSSCIDQHLYDVIVVNDGSTDNSLEICNKYLLEYSNLIILSQPNKGTSCARNYGLSVASGRYIWFVDADDSIVTEFFPILMNLLSKGGFDLFCFNHFRILGERKDTYKDYGENKIIDGVDFFRNKPSGFLWNKVYKKKSIEGLSFLEGTKNIEDLYFNSQSIIHFKKILCLTDFGYCYHQDNQSSTSRSKSHRNLIKLDQDSMRIHLKMKSDILKLDSVEKKKVIIDLLNLSITGHLFSLFRFYSYKTLYKRIMDYKNNKLYPVERTSNLKANIFLLLANKDNVFINIKRLIK